MHDYLRKKKISVVLKRLITISVFEMEQWRTTFEYYLCGEMFSNVLEDLIACKVGVNMFAMNINVSSFCFSCSN